MSEGTDSAGGFLVFDEQRAELLQIGLEKSIIRPNGAMVVPMISDTLLYPRLNDTSHASSVFGGCVAYWTAEATTMTTSQPTFGQTMLQAKDLTGYTQVSNNLINDSAISLEPFLKRAFGETWAWYEDLAFIRGTGSGQPLGILNSGALATVARQDTDWVTILDILKMYSQMLPGSHDRAIWIMNPEVFPAILNLNAENVQAVDKATSFHPMFLRNIVDPVAKTILGRPYFITEKMSALGDAGDIGFFDLSFYLIGDRQPLTIDVSEHVAFTSNQIAWRFVLRVDGQPWLASAITPYKGTATLSPFVTLSATS
jgi:HK97 family phage major capsid protein